MHSAGPVRNLFATDPDSYREGRWLMNFDPDDKGLNFLFFGKRNSGFSRSSVAIIFSVHSVRFVTAFLFLLQKIDVALVAMHPTYWNL